MSENLPQKHIQQLKTKLIVSKKPMVRQSSLKIRKNLGASPPEKTPDPPQSARGAPSDKEANFPGPVPFRLPAPVSLSVLRPVTKGLHTSPPVRSYFNFPTPNKFAKSNEFLGSKTKKTNSESPNFTRKTETCYFCSRNAISSSTINFSSRNEICGMFF